jgi:hypothetical protein
VRPSPAEIARTLVAGRLAGTVQAACRPGPLPVDHATDGAGRPLLLTRVGSAVAESLRPRDEADDLAVVLTVADVPPVHAAPTLGRAYLSGWVTPLTGTEARAAACEFAEVNPLEHLLDLGRGYVLHRLEPAEVRLDRSGATIAVGLDDYLAADPDPLHDVERDLLADLADHHGPEVDAFVAGVLAEKSDLDTPPGPARVVRIDRYGMVVAWSDGPLVRMEFTRAVRGAADLAELLHPVLFPGC